MLMVTNAIATCLLLETFHSTQHACLQVDSLNSLGGSSSVVIVKEDLPRVLVGVAIELAHNSALKPAQQFKISPGKT